MEKKFKTRNIHLRRQKTFMINSKEKTAKIIIKIRTKKRFIQVRITLKKIK